MNSYCALYNLNQKQKCKRLKQKEVILMILLFLGLIIALSLAGKADTLL